jgi:hypothetical protein
MRTLTVKINKILGLVCLLLLFPSDGLSQEVKKTNVEDSLYYKALFASLDKMAKSWGKIDSSVGGARIGTDYLKQIVQKTDITTNLPSQIGEYQVEYLDHQGLIYKSKQLKKPFSILVGSPMINEGERLKISFTVYYFSYKKKMSYFGLSDWSNVYFRFDCDKREFVVDEVELGGI